VDGYLLGSVKRDLLYEQTDWLTTALQNTPPPQEQMARCVGLAARNAGLVALYDEILEPTKYISADELADPQDPDHFDCASWAACATSGGFWVADEFDADKSREFWLWYLDTAVPAAWSSVGE
jgi:hypothetical protein